jgi:hypothetical protein
MKNGQFRHHQPLPKIFSHRLTRPSGPGVDDFIHTCRMAWQKEGKNSLTHFISVGRQNASGFLATYSRQKNVHMHIDNNDFEMIRIKLLTN